jgi:hypothetical protein
MDVKQRQGWDDNVEKNIPETVCGDITWIHISWDKAQWRAVMNTVTKIPFP